MANQETQKLDSIIASRRTMLMGTGAAALAAAFLPERAKAALTPASIADTDILNFALNLEYLEANFYYLAAFGTNIYTANANYPSGAAIQGITGTGTQGVVLSKASPKVPFTIPQVAAYAVETAIEEGKHVAFLRSALNTAAVAMPQIDLTGGSAYGPTAAWNALATAATIGPTFDPFASDVNFLAAAYVFEDVGVTAYHGAAPLFSAAGIKSGLLGAAASILAVEAYHAGLIRTTINLVDPMNTSGYITLTQKVSNLRQGLSKNALATSNPAYPFPTGTYGDDIPLTPTTTPNSVLLNGVASPATTLVDADITTAVTGSGTGTAVAFSRTTNQVLNIVTGGGINAAGTKSTGVFFPAGLNGVIA